MLAAYAASGAEVSLADYLHTRVFRGASFTVVEPYPDDVAGFTSYLTTYRAGLPIELAAAQSI